MKRLFCLLLTLMLLMTGFALAEDDGLDFSAWESLPDTYVYLDDDQVTTVIRYQDQPFFGQCDSDDDTICVFLDFVEDPNLDRVLVRLSLSLQCLDEVHGETMSITVNNTSYTFSVYPRISEYDLVYQEEYCVCLTAASLPMLKAIAKGKRDSFSFTISGDRVVSGTLSIPVKNASAIYSQYTKLKGDKQDLAALDDYWPCEVKKK